MLCRLLQLLEVEVLLWDSESRSWGRLIDQLPELGKRKLALDAIDLCFGSFRPSFDALFNQSTVVFARETLQSLREMLHEDSRPPLGPQFFDDLYTLKGRDHSPGVASIIMALAEYSDSIGRDLSSADVLAIMSACYEAVLNSERIPRVTMDAERTNDNCVSLILAQRDLIDRALSA
jgi:hypothetical protein